MIDEIRFMPPSRFDSADHGSIVHVKGEDEEITLWVQTSQDREHPEWKPASEILIKIFKKNLQQEAFVNFIMRQDEPWAIK